MGLKSGKYGIKQYLGSRNMLIQNAGSPPEIARKLKSVGEDLGLAALVDINVMLMAVPSSLRSFQEYLSCLSAQLRPLTQNFDVVVCCCDFLDAVPQQKAAEQRRRDTNRARGAAKRARDDDEAECAVLSSESPAAIGDGYLLHDLMKVDDLHRLTANRTSRYRLLDELIMSLSKMLPSIVFDGVDTRGADRPIDEIRSPTIYSALTANDRLVEALQAYRLVPIGEADLKLVDIEEALRDFFESPLAFLHLTIDTDAVPIQLLSIANEKADAPLCMSYVCFRRPVSNGPAEFDLLDMYALQAELAQSFGKTSHLHNASLFAATCAIAGCDFITSPCCFRTTELLEALARVVRRREPAAEVPASELGAESLPLTYERLLRCVGAEAGRATLRAGGRNSGKRALDLNDVPVELARRAAWTTRYWAGGAAGGGVEPWGFAEE